MFRYLKGTVREGLLHKRGAREEVWGYADSGHACDSDNSSGRMGYVFLSGGAVVS